MSSLVETYSKFYYGFIVDTESLSIDIDEGSGEFTATLAAGEYSFSDFIIETQRALNDSGALDYIVSGDRVTRLITITGSGNFDLLVQTGAHAGASAFSLLGFTGSDRTGLSVYTGNSEAGFQYTPQFRLQSYIDQSIWQQAADASINKTANGRVEIISFGIEKFFQWNINFATNIYQSSAGPIINNPNGLNDLTKFMIYAITRSPIEFMPDKNDPDTFYKIILESTPDNQMGVGFKLKELYDKNVPGYFETGNCVWRLIED